MKSYGFQPYTRIKRSRQHSGGGVLAISAILLAYLLFLPWFAGTTFGPSHNADDLDFSALRAKVHLSARNESRHLRDADRDDSKGAAPPNDTPYILVDSLPLAAPPRAAQQGEWNYTPLARSSYRNSHQPRAPPLQPS
jgi:hypothetical protein